MGSNEARASRYQHFLTLPEILHHRIVSSAAWFAGGRNSYIVRRVTKIRKQTSGTMPVIEYLVD
jgi:hypothetical protein